MPPKNREPPPKYPPPRLPPDPGDLPGCTQLEADLKEVRAKLVAKQAELEEAAKVIRQWSIDCTAERAGGVLDTGGACKKYLELKAAFDALSAEFNRLNDEYRNKANEYNQRFPACQAPTCPNGQPPKGQLPPLQFPTITLPSMGGYITNLTNCKNTLATKLAELEKKIRNKLDNLNDLANLRDGLQQPLRDNKTFELKIEGRLEVIDVPPPRNLATEIPALLKAINEIAQKIYACDTDDKYARLNQIPTPERPRDDFSGVKFRGMLKKWLKQDAAAYVINVSKALSDEIDKLKNSKKCIEELIGDTGKIQLAIDALSDTSMATYQNHINKQIHDIIAESTTLEITSASISYTLANQPGNDAGATLNINDPQKLATLVTIDRSVTPPVTQINLGVAKDLISKKVGPQNECPPKQDNPGVWTLPITVTANIRQFVKDPDKLTAKLSRLSFKIGNKIDCTKECPTIDNGDPLPINIVGIAESAATITSCEGAPQK